MTAPTPPIAWLIARGREILSHLNSEWKPNLVTGLESWQRELLRQQIEFRRRSRSRFPHPERWLWTDVSLSQASDHWSARFKSQLFPPAEAVVDACCGAGSDLVALAARGQVVGIEADPSLAALAHDNVRAHGSEANVVVDRVPSQTTSNARWLSIDPDRRASGTRTVEANAFSPPLDQVLEMAQHCQGVVIKLAPSTRMDEALEKRVDNQCCRLWLGNQGECRQLLLLTGELRKPDRRSAVLCEPLSASGANGANVHLTEHHFAYSADVKSPHLREPVAIGPFVFDLHPTLHAADLQCWWGSEHELNPVGEAHGYYSGSQPIYSPWAQTFEVLEVLPWDDRKIRRWLRSVDAGQVEVKTRGTFPLKLQIDANECQRRYSRAEGQPVTLLATRIGDRLRGIAARRLLGRPRTAMGV